MQGPDHWEKEHSGSIEELLAQIQQFNLMETLYPQVNCLNMVKPP